MPSGVERGSQGLPAQGGCLRNFCPGVPLGPEQHRGAARSPRCEGLFLIYFSCSWSLTPFLGLLLHWHSSALRVSALGVELGSAGLQGRGGSLYPGVSQDQRASLCSCRVLRRTEEFAFAKLVAPDQVGAVFKVCFRGFLSTLGPAAWDAASFQGERCSWR